ncbi:hypothetical protein [Devosia sp. SL43]|uniref:hypothetical protein n=1 Tax=Devosia sp. SL43 TaxID=2806348 RepID=UPI001F1B5346|nr:hypothetical protein [Devosia sp. SL43]UJW86310.1 hypothetical protein IM737_03275 [Devosia sp. SL43]
MKITLSLLTVLALTAVSLPASANTGTFSAAATVTQSTTKTGAVMVLARHGADDPATHDQFDDKGGNRPNKGGKGRGGRDDGPNHT